MICVQYSKQRKTLLYSTLVNLFFTQINSSSLLTYNSFLLHLIESSRQTFLEDPLCALRHYHTAYKAAYIHAYSARISEIDGVQAGD